jgi:6-phosphogluconolactonase
LTHSVLVFIGTYTEPILFGTGKVLQGRGEGIYGYRLDAASGALDPIGRTTGVANPSYLAFDPSRRFLYAVNELKTYEGEPTGTVSAFAVDARTGSLRFLNRQITHGTDPCHVAVDTNRGHVFVANFMSGSVCVLPVREDGSLAEACDVIQHQGSSIDPRRQSGPHAHSVTLDASGRFACIPDLGLDKVMVYRFDAARGKLERNLVPWIELAAGAGPRHLVFHPGGKLAYLVNELDSTVVALSYDSRRGAFGALGTVRTLPEEF